MDFSHIKKVAEAITKQANDNEKLAIPLLSAKLAKATEAYPEDYTLGMVNNVIARMGEHNKLFISRAELRELYNKLYSRNSKFASVFKEELGQLPELATPKRYDRTNTDDANKLMQTAYDKIVDPVLVSALSGLFGDDKLPASPTMISRAKTACQAQTAGVDLKKDFEVVTAGDGVIIYRASFETPKGITSVFIPVEFSEQNPLLPQVFVGNSGPEELTSTALAEYIQKHTGEKIKVDPKVVLKAAMSVKGDISKVNAVDLAVSKLNASRETPAEMSAPTVIGQKLDSYSSDLVVKTPDFKNEEVEKFAKIFDSPLGVANFKFKKPVVLAGRDMVAKASANFGLKNAQISVCDSNKDTVFFAVSANSGRVAFKVPVKIETNKPVFPTMMISNGSADVFSKQTVDAIVAGNSIDYKVAAIASPHYNLKPSELVEIVRQAASEGNIDKAEDALNVLMQTGDQKAYAVAFAEFSNSLSDNKKTAKEEAKCSMIVQSSSSQHPVCGHTGLPVSKVYQDKHGNCQPLYRKRMEDSADGAPYMINSKIYFQ